MLLLLPRCDRLPLIVHEHGVTCRHAEGLPNKLGILDGLYQAQGMLKTWPVRQPMCCSSANCTQHLALDCRHSCCCAGCSGFCYAMTS
jgi:hypothetical protein